jgi:zinc transporter ZupT
MHLIFNLLLFIVTFAGGSLPLWLKGLDDKKMLYILSFSGSFLLGITFLHLLPETFAEIGERAGLLMLAGFFLQLIIQRVTHGIEHGHVHVHPHEHHVPLFSILAGLSLHAFMEGLPLGFNYRLEATEPSLYLAVAAHKLPEAMLVTTLVASVKNKRQAVTTLLFFSLLTPMASILASFLGIQYRFIAQLVIALIPIVAGAFIHISTTIFFESGTKQHMLTRQKIVAILLGVGIALATLALE